MLRFVFLFLLLLVMKTDLGFSQQMCQPAIIMIEYEGPEITDPIPTVNGFIMPGCSYIYLFPCM